MATLRIKRSETPFHRPTSLEPGEIVANTFDQSIFLGLFNSGVAELSTFNFDFSNYNNNILVVWRKP